MKEGLSKQVLRTRLVWLGGLLRDILVVFLVHLFPRDSKKILFGAWGGHQFSDNPKYFLLYVLVHTDARCVWVGDEYLRGQIAQLGMTNRVRFVRKGSLLALWHFLTVGGGLVFNINWRWDICDFPLPRKVPLLNLWHGIPFKRVGEGQLSGCMPSQKARTWLRRRLRAWLVRFSAFAYPQASWTSVSSKLMAEELEHSFPGRFSRARMVYAGLPRNDFLVAHRSDEVFRKRLREKYGKLLGLPKGKQWWLYLPTFRYQSNEVFSFASMRGRNDLKRVLDEQQAIIIEKQHPRVLPHVRREGEPNGVFLLSQQEGAQIDLQELLLASDRLVTDYSSCFFDFALLERPVIHFAYDYETYATKDTGVIYNLFDVAAGPVCKTEQEVLLALSRPDAQLLAQRGAHLSEVLAYEKGGASKALLEGIGIQLKAKVTRWNI